MRMRMHMATDSPKTRAAGGACPPYPLALGVENAGAAPTAAGADGTARATVAGPTAGGNAPAAVLPAGQN